MSPTKKLTILLVDGYNAIGNWSELQQIRDRENLEAARRQLIESLINYAAWQHWETSIVFDAYASKESGYREDYTEHVSAYYTGFAQTADTYIEKYCAAFARSADRFDRQAIVATSDRLLQQTVRGYGAKLMSARELAIAVRGTQHRIKQKHRPQRPAGRFLFNSLDPQAQQRLTQWRMGQN
ncbi:MAG: NYN domain-containing protein [Spirulina sp.]